MEIIIAIILALFVVVALYLLIKSNRKLRNPEERIIEAKEADPTCCGAHEVCETDLVKVNPDKIEYFDDEELDLYKNIGENSYSDEQIDLFREILYTLKTNEIHLWLISLMRRGINLPSILKEEARNLLA
jgi:hypothetical protein